MQDVNAGLSGNVNKFFMFAVILLLWGALYLPKLGVLENQGTESRRMMPASEMYHGGSLMIPKLAGKEYIAKPPLIYWLQTASYAVAGETASAARFPTTVFILLFASVLLLMSSNWLNLYGRFIGAVIFLTAEGVIMSGRSADIDGGYMAATGLSIIVWLNLYYSNKSKLLLWIISGIILGVGMLFKGPLILLFFYILMICVAIYERSLKKIFCWQHLLGIVIMLAMFLPWMFYVYSNYHSGTAETQVSAYWYSQMIERFGESFGKWPGRVIGAIADFGPWFLLVPLLWMKKWTKNIPEDKLRVFKILRLTLVVGFIMVNFPGTRSRYSLPLYPVAAVLIGWLLVCNNKNGIIYKYWKKLLFILFPIIAVISVLLFLISPTGIFTAVVEKFVDKIQLVNPVVVYLPSYFVAAVALIVTVGCVFLIFKNKEKYNTHLHLVVLTALGIVLIALNVFTMVTPFADLVFHKKQLGVGITQAVPKGKTLYIYKQGYEPFYYYFKVPQKYVYNNNKLPEIIGGGKYFFMDSDKLKYLEQAYSGKYQIRIITKKTYKDDDYLVVEVAKTP